MIKRSTESYRFSFISVRATRWHNSFFHIYTHGPRHSFPREMDCFFVEKLSFTSREYRGVTSRANTAKSNLLKSDIPRGHRGSRAPRVKISFAIRDYLAFNSRSSARARRAADFHFATFITDLSRVASDGRKIPSSSMSPSDENGISLIRLVDSDHSPRTLRSHRVYT